MRSLNAERFMTKEVVTFSPEMDVTDAIFELARHEISGAPVVDDQGRLVGMLTERDCLDPFLKASYHEEPGGPVSEYMSKDVQCIDADTDVLEIARLFVTTKYRRFPVIRGNRVIGLVSRRDALKALLKLSFNRTNRGS